MYRSSLRRLLRLACLAATLGLAAAYCSVSLADGCPASCNGNRFNIDVSVDSSIITNGSTVHYTVFAYNNLAPFSDGCDAGVSSCNPTFGHGVSVQFCCPSPTGEAYPLFDFAPGHCSQLSAPSGDNFPAGGGGTLQVYPPVACVVNVNPGVGQATGLAGAGDATNPNNPNPNLGTIHFPAGDRGVQASKPIPVLVVSCGDGALNQACEKCDTNVFPANAPPTHGACRTGGTCGVEGCTFCGDGVVNGPPGAETCDDGNAIDNDGCRNNCTLPICGDGVINETCETCDGAAFPANAPSSHGACRTGACGNPGCTFCGDGVVNGGEACDDGNTIDTDGCRNDCTIPPVCGDGTINESCETCDTNAFPAGAPATHGACRTGACGNPGCTFCGDGIVNGGELCDDGNAIDTDGCRNNCQPPAPACGDGTINQACETCDTNAFPTNAPVSHGPCRVGATCGVNSCNFCGDGVVNGGEQCDDGNAIDTDGCRNNCQFPACGDGLLNQACERCDTNVFPANAPATHGACRTGGTCGSVGCTFCGDGVVNGPPGAEVCDDGNAVNGDACNNDCTPPLVPCNLTVTKTCAVPQPPTSNFVCSGAKPLDSITMIWRGAETIGIKAWKGAIGSTLLLTLDGIQPNQEVTVTGYAGSPNDVIWEIFNAGGTKIGNSTFHLSCSDVDMNGPEDCGKPEGDGKGLSGYINLWEFEGMGGNGQVLDCTVTPPTPSTTCDLQDNGVPGCAELGHPTSLTFRYSGGGCGASQNTQAPGKATCTGAIDPSLPVTITTSNSGYTITPSSVLPGALVTVSASKFNADSFFTLTNSGGSEVQKIHTSCSQPLNAGDIFGSLTLVAFNGQTAGTEVTYAYTIHNSGGAISNVNLEDDKLGHIAGPLTLAAGESQTFTKVTNVSVNTTNVATVTGQNPGGPLCTAQASATVTRPPCPPAHSSIKSDFNGTSIPAGRNIWFNANFKASGIASGTTTTIHFENSTITFNVGAQAFNLPVPDGTVVFDPAASCATTTFDAGSNTWLTTVPTSGSDEIFLSGLAFVVPFNFPGGIKPVTWQGDFSVDKAGVSVSWKWSAAVYTTDMTNYNANQVKPAHTNTCQYQNSDHAGTPEAKKAFVVGGARGGGGSNFTGSWSGTSTIALICVEVPQTAAVEAVDTLIFDSDQLLAWTPSLNAVFYDVVRGSIDDLRAQPGTGTAACAFDDLPSVLVEDYEVPAPGQCFFYVVRGDAISPAPGTYDDLGADGRDAQMDAGGLNCTHRD